MAAKAGDTVKVHYTGTLQDGYVFDSSRERNMPLEFKLGAGMVLAGFENAVMGQEVGYTATFTLQPEDAYGVLNEDLIYRFPHSAFPEGVKPEVGRAMQLVSPEGVNQIVAYITEVNEDDVVLDANHELAGKALTFDIELVGVN